MLDIAHPVDVNNLYVEVNVLEEITSYQWREVSDLLEDFNPDTENFDRWGLGKRQKRIPGLDAAKKYSKMRVLGKPGAGKTTFLKHLAMECNEGRFQPNRVPVYLALKDWVEDSKDSAKLQENKFRENLFVMPIFELQNNENIQAQRQNNEISKIGGRLLLSLKDYINKEFCHCGISESEVTEALLSKGKMLILLDGLDEVPSPYSEEVAREIKKFFRQYYKNQFVITCRIAASKYIYPGFTDIEIADFNQEQIQSFVHQWFVAVARNSRENGFTKAKCFLEKLARPENKQIRELAVTPILLNLTCLVFYKKTDFPSNRARLYEQGVDILLIKWDESRGIKRDEIYRNLTVLHKKQLLSYVAANTFENAEYFLEQGKIQKYIANYLFSFCNINTEQLQLQEDSHAVLKAIEVQHGLLIERAKEIYSFSHLTFQEYFTARRFIANYEPINWQLLSMHITDKRWREVFLLAVEMLHPADNFLLSIKQRIDRLLKGQNLHFFLEWIYQKSVSVQVKEKPATIREFYIAFAIIDDCNLNRTIGYILNPTSFRSPSVNFTFGCDLARGIIRILSYVSEHRSLFISLEPELIKVLQPLYRTFPHPDKNREEFQIWWQLEGQSWVKKLRLLLIKNRHIVLPCRFTNREKKYLKNYHEANKLLIDCLNSSCDVTATVRKEIEDTLFLPIAELVKASSEQ